MEINEIEELCKTVNRNAIKALLHNAALMKDPNTSPELRAQAEANVKAISYNKPLPHPDKPKKIKQQKVVANTPVTPAVDAAPKVEFHEEFAQHHGIDPVKFKETWSSMNPKQQQVTRNWHAEQVLKPKINKSIDSLYNLFTELKKHL